MDIGKVSLGKATDAIWFTPGKKIILKQGPHSSKPTIDSFSAGGRKNNLEISKSFFVCFSSFDLNGEDVFEVIWYSTGGPNQTNSLG